MIKVEDTIDVEINSHQESTLVWKGGAGIITLPNHHRDEGLVTNHTIIQILTDKIIELSERVARLEKNDS